MEAFAWTSLLIVVTSAAVFAGSFLGLLIVSLSSEFCILCCCFFAKNLKQE